MNLVPIANLLVSAALGIKGKNIFINLIPAECHKGILLRNPLQGTLINYELPGYYKTQFQLIVRTQNYAEGEALAKAAHDALTITETQVGPLFIRFMRPTTMPIVFPLSKGNLLEFATNFDVVFNE